MKLPGMVNQVGRRKAAQVRFGGYEHTAGASDGDIYDMTNLSSACYPLLSPRPKRANYKGRQLAKPNAVFGHEKLLYVDGTGLYYDDVLRGSVTDGPKQIAALGDRLIIFPDKKVLNVTYERKGTYSTLSALREAVTAPAKFDAYGVGGGCPYEMYVWDGESWICNGKELDELEAETQALSGVTMKSEASPEGKSETCNALYCQSVDFSAYFRAGDAITITGCSTQTKNNKTPIIRELSADGHTLYFSDHALTLGGGDGTTAYTESGALKLRRSVPDLTAVCTNENRVWGCMDDTIYCSALGDPYNWYLTDGTEADSWACATGTPGSFTGCCAYLGYPVFFKERAVCKVYGSLPSNFAPMSAATLGAASGGGRSFAVAGEILFYLTGSGIAAYSGGVPKAISGAFGNVKYTEAVGGSDGLKYYVSMKNESGAWSLFVYDTALGLWHREDGLHAVGFARADSLYCLSADGKLWMLGEVESPPGGSVWESGVSWSAEFGDFTDNSPNAKGVSKLQLRMELDSGSTVTVKIRYDSAGSWETVKTLSAAGKRSELLPVIPRRADHYRLKLEGTGGCRVHSLSREYYSGSSAKIN